MLAPTQGYAMRFALAALTSLVLALTGCSSDGGSSSSAKPSSNAATAAARADAWTAPTTFRFATLGTGDAAKVEGVFQRRDLLYRRTSEMPLAYEVKGLRNAQDLSEVNTELSRVADIPFETAVMNFGGLDPAASAYTNVEIKVTPGAEAFVADGSAAAPWRRIFVDKSGAWKGLVNTRATVAKQAGWLYVAATKDGYTRYSRVNIGTRTAENLSFVRFKESTLPEPSKIGKSQTAEGKSEGFKWPWE